MRCSKRLVNDLSSSQPAATASSGLRSITQKQNFPPLSLTNIAARKEISGGEVSAMVTSKRPSVSKRSEQTTRKLPKLKARRQRLFLPNDNDRMRMMSMSPALARHRHHSHPVVVVWQEQSLATRFQLRQFPGCLFASFTHARTFRRDHRTDFTTADLFSRSDVRQTQRREVLLLGDGSQSRRSYRSRLAR